MRKDIRHEVFDDVAPYQTSKKELFPINASRFGFKQTTFLSMDGKSQTFSQRKLYEVLDYHFLKEDFLGFWEADNSKLTCNILS